MPRKIFPDRAFLSRLLVVRNLMTVLVAEGFRMARRGARGETEPPPASAHSSPAFLRTS